MKNTIRNYIVIVLVLLLAASVFTLAACKSKETYTVTFNSNGGSVVNSTLNVPHNTVISEPPAPTREGYTFKGWFSDIKLTNAWNFASDKVKSNMTLYAKWEYNATNGLKMLNNNTSYTVAGIGDAVNVRNIIIPDKYNNLPVTKIADRAFEGVTSIESVFIPDSVTSAGYGAFRNCGNLTSAVFSGNTELGERVFENCSKLERVTLPDNLTEIKNMTFRCCASLQEIEIPSGVSKIGEQAFYECKKISSVTLPAVLTSIGSQAFSSCEKLTEITLPASVRTLGENAFSGCVGLASLSVENGNGYFYSEGNCIISFAPGENGKTVNTLVAGCKNSRIPTNRNITVIGAGAFYGCRTLTEISIPSSVTTIDNHAFSGCVGLERVSVPASVTKIGDGAFSGCEYLLDITFGTNNVSELQYIGREAFSYCNSLTGFTIPVSVTFIGAGVFYSDTPNGITVSFPGSPTQLRAIEIGKVEEGEENPYVGSIDVRCEESNTTITIVGIA